jgi:hypothetical protein
MLCRDLWKLGATTARIQYQPDCNVVPGPCCRLPRTGISGIEGLETAVVAKKRERVDVEMRIMATYLAV